MRATTWECTMKRMIAVFAVSLLLGLPTALMPVTSAQEVVVPSFPSLAIIRGENIRLRAEPAEQAADVAIMQRGDEIRITGEAVAAGGLDFYPVELVSTGQTGWVRALFINPRSITPVQGAALPRVEVSTEPIPTEEATTNQQQRRNRNAQDEVTPTPEPANAANDRQARRAQRQAERAQAQAENAAAATPTPETPPPASPAPEPTSVAPPVTATASVAGVGPATSEPITLEPGRYRATASMQVTGRTRFTATLNGPNGFSEALFDERIDTPQAWTAGTVVRIRDAGDYTVDVTNAEQAWSIAFEPLPARQ
jgi:hypothetical protein